MLDPTPPTTLKPVYAFLFDALDQAGVVDSFRSVGGTLLLALDGTEYFSSQAIHCACCSTRRHANGQVTYFHSALTPVLVRPGCDKVIALAPEFVTPQDGTAKQDCELAAAKRWLAAHGAELARLKTTVLGDDLYCHEPFCRELLALALGFILVCKPDSHAIVYAWLEHLERNGAVQTVVRTRWTGRRHETDTYRYAHSIPLRDADDALEVNWCELVTTDGSGKVLYRNAFATSLALDDGNIAEVVEAGRGRWKIENENNNTLKTKGYHFDHNFGHGKQNLANLFATLILLAFLMHTALDCLDTRYAAVRALLPSRRTFFEHLRALLQYLPFDDWDHLLRFMHHHLDPSAPDTS